MKLKMALALIFVIFLSACAGQMVKPAETPVSGAESAATSTPVEEPENAYVFIEGDAIMTDSGLQYVITEHGDGATPQSGDIVEVNYTGRFTDGNIFDSSYEREKPLRFKAGSGQVISGWDEAIMLLRVGDKAKLIIPPELAYGEAGVGQDIPPDSTLYFEVELLGVQPPDNTPPVAVAEADYTVTDSGLKYYDIKVGDGDSPRRGEMPLVHYVGWLEDGTKIDSSRDRGAPIHFTLGAEQVIPGWDEGILTMKVGGKRQLVIPPELAFGEEGAGNGLIPPNAILIYEVELIAISDYHP
jgi:peptidylprolyl isomerase